MHPQGWTGRGTGCLCRTGASAGGGITRRERFLSVLRRPIGSAAGVPGAKPPAKQTKNLSLPRRGRGGGWGKKRKVKAGAAGGKAGKPPSGFRKGIVIRRPPGQAPRRVPQWKGQPMPLPAQPRGCKGRSPLHKKTKNSPFPPGRGLGGWGQKSKPKTGLAGDKEGTSPAGQRQGKVSQRGGELFQESPGASPPQKRRRRSASDRGSPTAHRSAQCGGKSWR